MARRTMASVTAELERCEHERRTLGNLAAALLRGERPEPVESGPWRVWVVGLGRCHGPVISLTDASVERPLGTWEQFDTWTGRLGRHPRPDPYLTNAAARIRALDDQAWAERNAPRRVA